LPHAASFYEWKAENAKATTSIATWQQAKRTTGAICKLGSRKADN